MCLKHKKQILLLFLLLFLLMDFNNIVNAAVNLRIVGLSDTQALGQIDANININDTFYLDVWINAADTYYNTVRLKINYDSTYLEILDNDASNQIDTFLINTAGINLQNLSTDIIGDSVNILINSVDTASNTINYAAIVNDFRDSVGVNYAVDIPLARILLKAKNVASVTNTFLSFTVSDETSTFITYPDTPFYNVLGNIDSGWIVIQPSSNPQLNVVINDVLNSETYSAGADTITALSFTISADTNLLNDTLQTFTLANNGTLEQSAIDKLRLWLDYDSNNIYSDSDVLVSELLWTGANWRAININFAYNLSGANFVITIDLSDTATAGETFQALIPSLGIKTAKTDSAPMSDTYSKNIIKIAASMIADIICPDTAVTSYLMSLTNIIGTDTSYLIYLNNVDTLYIEASNQLKLDTWSVIIDPIDTGGYVRISSPSSAFINGTDTGNITRANYGQNSLFQIDVMDSMFRNLSANQYADSPQISFNFSGKNITTNFELLKLYYLNLADSKWYDATHSDSGIARNYNYSISSNTISLRVEHLSHWWFGALIDTVTVIKNVDVASDTVSSSSQNITVLSFYALGDTQAGDTLISLSIGNKEVMDTAHISDVKLWLDTNANFIYDTADVFIGSLNWNSGAEVWRNSALNYFMDTGANFVVTIDVDTLAQTGEKFQAYIPTQGVATADEYSAPDTEIINAGVITIENTNVVIVSISVELIDTGLNYSGAATDYPPGSKLRYTIEFSNLNTLPIYNVKIYQYIPQYTQYDDSSIEIDTDISDGINYISKTDANDGDEADYNITALNCIYVHLSEMPANKTGRLRFSVFIE